MVGRTGFGTLGQLHKFASENIIQTQLSGNLLGNIQMMSPPSIDVDLLKNKNIRIRIAQKIYDRPKLQAPVDVPIHNSNGTAWQENHRAGAKFSAMISLVGTFKLPLLQVA